MKTVQISEKTFAIAQHLAANTEGVKTVEQLVEQLLKDDWESLVHAALRDGTTADLVDKIIAAEDFRKVRRAVLQDRAAMRRR